MHGAEMNSTAYVTPTSFKEVSKAQDSGHTVSITIDGRPYSRCHNSKSCTNELGQLGRTGNPSLFLPMNMILPLAKRTSSKNNKNNNDSFTASIAKAAHGYVGGFGSAGHTAILDTEGRLWVCGCDRWQQLGLGSSQSGSSGYTWTGGKLWQEQLQLNTHVVKLLQTLDPSLGSSSTSSTAAAAANNNDDQSRRYIRDVALGGDHTVILSANKRDVITFGKGAEDQLGLSSKPFVSAPTKSKTLSSKSSSNISAVCAYRNCSLTLDDTGQVISTTGKCSLELQGMKKALDLCRKRAHVSGLIQHEKKQSQHKSEI